MSFVNKFKQANSATTLPQGVKLENTSFGQPTNTYTKPQFYPQQQPSTHQKGKPRGGWDDDEEDEPGLAGLNNTKAPTFTTPTTNVTKPVLLISTSNRVAEQPAQTGQSQELYKKFAVVSIDERFEQAHEYELKVVGELIQPGGARLRQPDIVLNDFCKTAENFQVEVVGSILLSSLSSQGIWISKARSIFAIEALVKNIAKYYSYFKHNIKYIRRNEFEDEGQNASQLIKFLDDLIDYLEDPEKGFATPQQIVPVIVSSTEPNSSASPEEIPVKAYSQSAVYSTNPGLLTSQLASESNGTDAPTPTDDINSEQPKPTTNSSASFLSKFKKNATQAQANAEQKKEENILDSLAGLNFSEEPKPQQQEPEKPKGPNFDDVYNLYLGANNHGHYGNMQYANMQNPNMNNMGYQYGHRMNGYSQQQQQQYYAQFARQSPQQYYQGQGARMAAPIITAEQPMSSEDYYKKKQMEENEKRFDNLKFGF